MRKRVCPTNHIAPEDGGLCTKRKDLALVKLRNAGAGIQDTNVGISQSSLRQWKLFVCFPQVDGAKEQLGRALGLPKDYYS